MTNGAVVAKVTSEIEELNARCNALRRKLGQTAQSCDVAASAGCNGAVDFYIVADVSRSVAPGFETYKELAKKWGLASLPEIHGGDKKIGTVQWVKERLESFPLMGLPKYVDDTPVVVGKPVELS